MKRSADVVICGAGILGVSAAYHLAVRRGVGNVVLVDPRPPLTLTSDKSTECYRNWWPGPGDAMVQLMNHSIALMEDFARESNNLFNLNRRGYLYVTTETGNIVSLQASALEASALGAGELREHRAGSRNYVPHKAEGFLGEAGADLLLDSSLIRKHFPYITANAVAAIHVRCAGWLSGQTLGMWMLEQAKNAGAQVVMGEVVAVDVSNNHVSGVTLNDGTHFETSTFVDAAGPYLSKVGKLLNVDIPVANELHLKAAFNDPIAVMGRDAPLVICADAQQLSWSAEERALLAEDAATASLLETLPSGAHTRPEGGLGAQSVLVLWDTHNQVVEPEFPIREDLLYAEVAVRGLARILPKMSDYVGRMPKPQIDGGYYTKTAENRPLASPLPVPGAYIIGAASGYGVMAAAGLGELLAGHVTGDELPTYAPMFDLRRYEDAAYRAMLDNWGDSWQL